MVNSTPDRSGPRRCLRFRRARRILRPSLEVLEDRLLLSGADPTHYEQYMLELINRARANPTAEVARFDASYWDGTPDLNEGLAPGTITSDAKQPLAFNRELIDAAGVHSLWMLQNDVFSHTGEGNSTPHQRMENAGYVFNPPWSSGENISWKGTTGVPDVREYVYEQHGNLFADAGIVGRGHRTNMMNPDFREIGVGIQEGLFFSGGTNYNAVTNTNDFAYSGSDLFLTGVVYDDQAVTQDNFYTPGEGLGNVTIQAVNAFNGATYTTSTWNSGGYTLAVPSGTYDVTASGGAFFGVLARTVAVGAQNVKVDFEQQDPMPDLTVSDIQGAAGTYLPKEPIAGNVLVTNQGTQDVTTTFWYQARLSTNKNWQNGTVCYQEAETEGVDAGESYRDYGMGQIPADMAPGSYYLGVMIDSLWTIAESNEFNNIVWTGAPSVVVKDPDYTLNGSNLTVHGTAGNDVIDFRLGAGNAQHYLKINGSSYLFDPTVTNIDIQAGAGRDTVYVYGTSAANEEATFWGATNAARLVSGGRTVYAQQTEKAYLYGQGGKDAATFKDSAGTDLLTSKGSSGKSILQTAGGDKYVGVGFERTYAYSQNGGTDALVYFDTTGNDLVTGKAGSGQAIFQTSLGDKVVGVGFAKTYAFSRDGNDSLVLHDSPGNDLLTGKAGNEQAVLQTAGGEKIVGVGFAKTYAFSSRGNDSLVLHDAAGNDVLTCKGDSDKSVFQTAGGKYVGVGFAKTYAFSNNGNDSLLMYDSAGNDTFLGKADIGQSILYAGAAKYIGIGFAKTYTYSQNGGDDGAYLYASGAGDDLFRANADIGQSMFLGGGLWWINTGFRKNAAYGSVVGSDVAEFYDTAGDDQLYASGNTVRLTTTGSTVSWQAHGFGDNHAYRVLGGTDVFTADGPLAGTVNTSGGWL